MSKTIAAVPESISRADYLHLIESVGFDPSNLMSLTFGHDSIQAVVAARDASGKRLVDPRLGSLTHTVIIPVTDATEAKNV